MKVLLVYPQYTHSSEFDSRAPSMSLFYLAAALEKDGHTVRIYDASLGPVTRTGSVYRYGYSDGDVERFLGQERFDMVGITCSFTARWPFVRRIAALVRKVMPDALILTGGLYPTYSWEQCLRDCPALDAVVLGEGEKSISKLAAQSSLRAGLGRAVNGFDGMAWRQSDGSFRMNPKTEFIEELDTLPFPAWHLADLPAYFKLQKNIFELKSPCLPLLSSRSCPCRCTFCNMFMTHGRKWRARTAENLLAEIEYMAGRFGVHNFYFVDDNFSLDADRAKEICRQLISRRIKIKYNFHNGLSIKTLDRELVRLMKQSGCTSVCLAVESGSEKVRNGIYRKNLSIDKIEQVFGWFREEGVPAIAYFMVGAPGETKADVQLSRQLIERLPASLVTVGIYTPYPATELYELSRNNGWLREPAAMDGERVEMFFPMLSTPDFSPQDVIRWQRELYMAFVWSHWPVLIKEFFRPGGVVNMDMIGRFLGMAKFRPGQQRIC